MFSVEQREHVRRYVLEMAKADSRVTGGALTGSTAFGGGDRWSDIDVAFGIADGVELKAVLDEWTQVLEREFGVLDYFDLHAGSSIYRVFLLPGGLEADVAVTPAREFGARGPNFRALFGSNQQVETGPPPSAAYLIGLGWHHVLHTRSCIERGKLWQAVYWVGELRNHVLALACLRLGENAAYARGVDRLPAVVTGALVGTLVRSLDELELRRALAVATRCLIGEVERWDGVLCARLAPLLEEFGVS
jgi:predicted nucleotidyltransferase